MYLFNFYRITLSIIIFIKIIYVPNVGLRASHMDDSYDFYKGDMHTNYPLVNGKLSVQCYFEALSNCYSIYRKKFMNKFFSGKYWN